MENRSYSKESLITQKQFKYGPGYSHILSSLKEADSEEYHMIFPRSTATSPTRILKRNIHKLHGSKKHIIDLGKTSKSPLNQLSSAEYIKE